MHPLMVPYMLNVKHSNMFLLLSTTQTLSSCTGLISTVVNLGEPVESRLVMTGSVDFGVVVN